MYTSLYRTLKRFPPPPHTHTEKGWGVCTHSSAAAPKAAAVAAPTPPPAPAKAKATSVDVTEDNGILAPKAHAHTHTHAPTKQTGLFVSHLSNLYPLLQGLSMMTTPCHFATPCLNLALLEQRLDHVPIALGEPGMVDADAESKGVLKRLIPADANPRRDTTEGDICSSFHIYNRKEIDRRQATRKGEEKQMKKKTEKKTAKNSQRVIRASENRFSRG